MAVGAKRDLGVRRRWKSGGARLGVLLLVLLAWRLLRPDRTALVLPAQAPGGDAYLGFAGVALCASGIGLAIWARVHIGRNWGMPMARKENPELVTSGPYARIRHPIYTGILLAALGSVLGHNGFWMAPVLLLGVYFVHSARREEALMLREFPQQYRAYMRRTNMLVPFVL